MSQKALQKAKPETSLTEILDVDIDECDVSVCLASLGSEDDLPTFQRLQLSDDLTEEFTGVIRQRFDRCRQDAENDDLKLQAYDAGSKPDPHEVEYVDLSKHDSIRDQIASLSGLTELPVFDADESFIAGLRFYAIVLQPQSGDDPVFCFRAYSQKKELRRSPFFGALLSKGQFDRVREPLFLFDQHVDCIARDGLAFIFSKDKFQKIFRFFEMVLKTARSTLKTIEAQVPIANFDEFQKACEGHLQMLTKLKNIAGKPYLASVTIMDIKKVMKEFPGLKVEIRKSKGKEMLVFDRRDKWALLRLLDDDYLKSVMTGVNYEVSGKRVY
jgi:Kiwa protein KwaB-like